MMMRQASHSSSMSGFATSAASPKGRLSFFSKKKPSMSGSLSREGSGSIGSSDTVFEVGVLLEWENGRLTMI
jgi:hypothetical protein